MGGQAPKSRDELLDAHLGELAGLGLSFTCHEGCERAGSYSLRRLAEVCGPRVQLKIALKRLKCSGCKRPPARVVISDGVFEDGREQFPTWRVQLVP